MKHWSTQLTASVKALSVAALIGTSSAAMAVDGIRQCAKIGERIRVENCLIDKGAAIH